ncbi:hypothetical protein K438DRAFT_1765592 [Mycena galopus ATCC 62051]|nr:hypothetical protein K438DRAFT_1765592 [Mycena galopus ATCC 62051]
MSATDADGSEALLDSATPLVHMPRIAPKRSPLKSSGTLRLLSLMLHLALVVIHLTLLGVWHGHLEHRLIFSSSLDTQTIVSFSITATLTSFVTAYSSGLVFVTQVLFTRRNLMVDQTLTATHDAATAWAGIGSAIAHIWSQRTIPASVGGGVLSAFLYLGNILVLHITIPTLFSLQSFNSPRSFPATTQSLPAFNFSGYDLSSSSNASGLYGGTLYDVLEPNTGTGNVTVNATGFNVTCRYLTDFKFKFIPEKGHWAVTSENGSSFGTMEPTGVGIISALPGVDWIVDGILLYSTAQVVDSSGNVAFQADLTPSPIRGLEAFAQLLLCSQSLVTQQAVVDTQSRQLISVTPNITKTASTWPSPVTFPSVYDQPRWDILTNSGMSLTDLAPGLYPLIPESGFPRIGLNNTLDDNFVDSTLSSLSFGDIFLSQQLNLLPLESSLSRVALHELENALSVIFASMMWTSNIPVPPWLAEVGADMNFLKTSSSLYLLQGSATVTEEFTQTRLDLSIIAVATGLGVSIILTLLSLPSTIIYGYAKDDQDIPIDGTGILHAIWLYRNHPDLEMLLEQVEHPTDSNLREAGMVRTSLVGRRLSGHNSYC